VVHLVNMVVNVLFNDSGSWLDFIAYEVDELIMLCIFEELLTGQKKCRKICPISTLPTKNST
jgi:hypothetical protein